MGALSSNSCTVKRASKAPGAGLGTRRRTGLSSQQVVQPPEVPPGPLLFHEKRLWICTPANAKYTITAGWTGGAGRRQRKKNQMKKCQSGAWTQAWTQDTTTTPHSQHIPVCCSPIRNLWTTAVLVYRSLWLLLLLLPYRQRWTKPRHWIRVATSKVFSATKTNKQTNKQMG